MAKFPTPSLLLFTLALLAADAPSMGIAQPAGSNESSAEFFLSVKQQRRLAVDQPTIASLRDLAQVFKSFPRARAIQLPPLSQEERNFLSQNDDSEEMREKIGIDRELPQPVLLQSTPGAVPGSILAQGLVGTAPGGGLSWTIEIVSPGATGLRVEFEPGQLPEGGRIYVTDGQSEVYGPYTLGPEPTFSNTVFSSRIFVQLQVPRGAALTGVSIRRIAHLVEPIEGLAVTGGPAANLTLATHCNLKQFCKPTSPVTNPTPEQSAFETATRGVARIIYKEGAGHYKCSGGLLADNTNSRTPFFLTANHCFNTQASATSLEAFFRYRKPCNGAVPKLSQVPRTLGSTLLATSGDTDFTLVQLSQTPPSDAHFFRWTSEDLSNSTTPIFRVHHPHGYPMHKQTSRIRPVGGCKYRPKGRYIYSTPTDGGTAKGSSGSLVYRLNGNEPEVVGQLYGSCTSKGGCGYANVDGAFAMTFPKVRQYLVH
ncbi:MAG TPA: trypsin-like peptidase domain-containing protein [Allosphingosinicella sp.]|jgi:V8-like Glu-specific endopeptidase